MSLLSSYSQLATIIDGVSTSLSSASGHADDMADDAERASSALEGAAAQRAEGSRASGGGASGAANTLSGGAGSRIGLRSDPGFGAVRGQGTPASRLGLRSDPVPASHLQGQAPASSFGERTVGRETAPEALLTSTPVQADSETVFAAILAARGSGGIAPPVSGGGGGPEASDRLLDVTQEQADVVSRQLTTQEEILLTLLALLDVARGLDLADITTLRSLGAL